ncbi:MAG: hypothetical protein H7Y01_15270 [Ferruginibacter sp.]|nr:hypothetical protein [Chitinophagaceae bacterium]
MKFRFNLSHLVTISFLFSLLLITSCQKENSQNGTDDQQQVEASRVSSESDGEAEIVFNGLFDDAIGVNDEVGIGGTGIFGRTLACPDITIVRLSTTGGQFPVKIIFDFGVNGCTGNDGHLRRGKIITEYSNKLLIPGATATTTFDGFYFDSTKVEGRHKITNTSPPLNTQPPSRQFTVDVNDAKLSKPNGNFIEWTSHKVITQIDGLGTILPIDDNFKVEGHANGKVKRGSLIVLWQSAITEPLMKRFNCRWISKGRVRTIRANTTANSPWVAELDFGLGTCDNQAVVKINGIPHQITLP